MTASTSTVTAFPLRVSADDAERTLVETDDAMAGASARTRLYYPYQTFEFEIRAEALLNSLADTATCGVDLRSGKELLLDDLPDPATKSVPTADVLEATVSESDAASAARTYVAQVAQKRIRFGRAPEIELRTSARRHRPFHLVDCRTDEGASLTYVVDGVSGSYHRVYLE